MQEADRLTKEAEKYKMERDVEQKKKVEKKRKEEEEAKWVRWQAEIRKEEVLKNNKLQDVKVRFFFISA